MSIFDNAKQAHRDRTANAQPVPTKTATASTQIQARQNTVTVDGTPVPIKPPDTVQTGEQTWLSAVGKYGRPRGRDAIQARKISQTWPMELIANGITDQLTGGELTAESDDGELDSSEAEIWSLIRDVIQGPHLKNYDLDDLISSAVADMLGPANAYWQLIPAKDGSLPVVTLVDLDALTIRHNMNKNFVVPEGEPAYWQARNAFSSEGIAQIGDVSPVPLEKSELAVMHYPGNSRSFQVYPKSPSLQVIEALELLANSTTHHNRFYNDNEIPPGFIQVLNAKNRTVEDVKDKVQAAKGDPRSVQVIGGEGQAHWVEMGGTSINLQVIEEQKWFLQLCLASVGLGKAEIGMIEDVNRANGEVEQSRVFKRVTGPFANQFEGAFKHIAQQFDVYNALDDPFTPTLRFTDPRAERAREERLRAMYNDGGLTLRQYVRRRGDSDLADNEYEIEVNGQVVNYGDVPKWVARELLAEARSSEERPVGDDEDTEEEQGVVVGRGAGGRPVTNGDKGS